VPTSPTRNEEDAEKEARRREGQRQYEARVSARARNLDLGAALARWQPNLDADAVRLLGSIVLIHYGKAACAHRLCVEQPATTNKHGKPTRPLSARRRGRAPVHAEAPRR
jgi:hypothetical protein